MSFTKLTKKQHPTKLLKRLFEENFIQEGGRALDLGAGPLLDSVFLAEHGYVVDAVDFDIESFKKCQAIDNPKIHFFNEKIQDFNFVPSTYDIVVSFLTLPFLPSQDFYNVLENISLSTKKGGFFCGSVFGNQDGWNKNDKMTFIRKDALENVLHQYFEVNIMEEEIVERKTVHGDMKRWHILRFIVKKK